MTMDELNKVSMETLAKRYGRPWRKVFAYKDDEFQLRQKELEKKLAGEEDRRMSMIMTRDDITERHD